MCFRPIYLIGTGSIPSIQKNKHNSKYTNSFDLLIDPKKPYSGGEEVYNLKESLVR